VDPLLKLRWLLASFIEPFDVTSACWPIFTGRGHLLPEKESEVENFACEYSCE